MDKTNFKKKLSRLAKKYVLSLVLVIIFDFFLFPIPILAETNYAISEADEIVFDEEFVTEPDMEFINSLPASNDIKVVKKGYYSITAYNSEAAQCDSTPCITANGFNLCEHGIEDSIAANFLRFGTKVKIPELFGDKVFIVRDRMNARYNNRIDIWMKDKQDAKIFGIKYAKIEVLES